MAFFCAHPFARPQAASDRLHTKKATPTGVAFSLAESEGFEPPVNSPPFLSLNEKYNYLIVSIL